MNAKVLKSNVLSVCGECASIHATPESAAAATKSMYAELVWPFVARDGFGFKNLEPDAPRSFLVVNF